jgi:putative spermidine/putrescine transport system permease protein
MAPRKTNARAFEHGAAPSAGICVIALSVLFFLTLPSLVVIPMSFGNDDFLVFPPRGFSLRLYEQFFFASDWMETTLLSVRVALVSTLLSLMLGSAAAYGLVRSRFRGRKLVMMALLSPMFVPGIVMALSLYIYFALVGLQGSEAALILAHSVLAAPYVIVVVMAALQAIDPSLELAARSMGAGRFYTFRRVMLPLAKSGIASAALFAFLLSFDELVIALFLADIDTKTLPVKMYENIRFEISPVLAVVSTLLTAAAFVLSLVITRSRVASQLRATGDSTGALSKADGTTA